MSSWGKNRMGRKLGGDWGARPADGMSGSGSTDKFFTYRFYDFARSLLKRKYCPSTIKTEIVNGDYLVYACPTRHLREFFFGPTIAYMRALRELVEVHSMNPPGVKDNPSNRQLAEAGYKRFHGSESEKIVTDELDWPPPAILEEDFGPFDDPPRNLSGLGELIAVGYEDEETVEEEVYEFRRPYPILASDFMDWDEGFEDLFVIGGNYKVDKKPDFICGNLIWVEYRTVKSFDDMKPTVYKHRFNDEWPILAQNEARDQLYILRGKSNFYIDRSEVSHGIVG